MPLLTLPSRRDWLRSAAGAFAAVAAHRLNAAESSKPRTSRWSMVSDTHISAEREAEFRGFRTYQNLTQAVEKIASARPDGCIISGDLARLQGTPGDYVQLKAVLSPLQDKVPVGFCLGNHDDRENFNTAFGPPLTGAPQQVKGKNVLIIERAPVRFILLDSLIVANETPGFLGKAQRTWLDKYLEISDNTPTLLAVHHTLDDEDGSLLDSDRLLRIAAKHRKVKAIFYGHSHRYGYDTYEGVHLVNVPATGYNFNERQPVGWLDANFASEGVELTLQAIGGNTADHGKSRSLLWRT
jgi:3',5'-cyclic AMP phosphodiesterase CpdA